MYYREKIEEDNKLIEAHPALYLISRPGRHTDQ